MTLVYSLSLPGYAVQVSDRLITKGNTAHDIHSNKTLIYIGLDGMFAASYTGLAYIEDRPTDQWLAEVLVGVPLDDPGFMMLSSGVRVVDVGQAAIRLRDACSRAVTKMPERRKTIGIEIDLVGWQWKRSRRTSLVRRLLWTIDRNGSAFRIQRTIPRHKPPEAAYLSILGRHDVLTPEESSDLPHRLLQAEADPHLLTAMLTDSISQASQRIASVGEHSLAVGLPLPNQRRATIQYVGAPAANVPTAHGDLVSDVGFSPWVLASGFVGSPSAMVGDHKMVAGDFEVDVSAPSGGMGLLGGVWSQHRPSEG